MHQSGIVGDGFGTLAGGERVSSETDSGPKGARAVGVGALQPGGLG